ncbi:MAG: hypothetical protein ACI3XG_03675 [Faecousia sp.]
MIWKNTFAKGNRDRLSGARRGKLRLACRMWNSWYFRNALVRANYTDLHKGITATTKYLELFFENLLLGRRHELKNRFLHIALAAPKVPNCILGELTVLNAIQPRHHPKRIGSSHRKIGTSNAALLGCRKRAFFTVKMGNGTEHGL